ncbi:phosphatidylcholine/phosphatidylserine synthase [bacterium]|nr:phosphatidylcholine/phosphatidylserine synthase [bacterium]
MIKNNPKVLIPNFFTVLNMLIGLTSIFYAIKGQYINAGWLILLSGVMDKLDGTAARFFKVSSMFGVEFDSYSDFISFGFAPAILVFSYFNAQGTGGFSDASFYAVAASAFYVVFCAVRLAKYNVSQSDDKEYFYGLTTTMSGGFIALYMIFAIENGFEWLLTVNLVAGMMMAHSIMLLIPFKYPKLKKPSSRSAQIIMLFSFALFLGLILVRILPWLIYITGVGYLVIGTLKTKKAFVHVVPEDSENEPSE